MDETADRELVTTRLIEASRERIFRAFREPAHLSQWWGPKGFRNTVHEFDFRSNGLWRVTMHGPDGVDYQNEYVFLEVEEGEKIVISHPDPGHSFQLHISLAASGAKTRLTWCMRFDSAEHCQEVKALVTEANEEVLDRLEAEVARIV